MTHSFDIKIYTRLGCPIHYWVAHNNSDNWLIFLHGVGCDHRMFKSQINAISKIYNILLWDERGHGKSRPLGDKLSFNIVVEDIIEIMKREGCSKATFIGHSQGGQIAQEVTYRYPNKVEKLILIGSNCNTKKLTILEKLAMTIVPALLRLYPWTYLIKHNMKTCSKNINIQKYVEGCYKTTGRRDYINLILATTKAYHFEKSYAPNKLILFLYGEYDNTLYTKEALRYWSKIENTCRCHMIKDAAHNANQDNPIMVNDRILKFLSIKK